VDVTVATFEEEVIKASFQHPVLVDLWAPWCGPCKVLGPVLDKLAMEAAGQWKLVKINTDEEQQLAQALRIQSLPAVKLFFQGRLISEFNGAQPENVIRDWLNQAMSAMGEAAEPPPPTGIDFVKEMMAAGRMDVAAQALVQILQEDPDNKEARVMLARLQFPQNPVAALEVVEGWTEEDPHADVVQAMKDLNTILGQAQESLSGVGVESFTLGCESFLKADFAGAAENWIDVVRKDRKLLEDGGRRACVALFLILGNEHPVTDDFRRTLSSVLF